MSTQARCSVCKKPLTSGDIGGTCKAHMGKIRLFAHTADSIPEGYIGMSKICRKYEEAGFTTHEIVKACGGNACTFAPFEEPQGLFWATYVGNRKYLAPAILTEGMELLRKAVVIKPAKAPAKVQPAGEVSGIAAALKTAVVIKK